MVVSHIAVIFSFFKNLHKHVVTQCIHINIALLAKFASLSIKLFYVQILDSFKIFFEKYFKPRQKLLVIFQTNLSFLSCNSERGSKFKNKHFHMPKFSQEEHI